MSWLLNPSRFAAAPGGGGLTADWAYVTNSPGVADAATMSETVDVLPGGWTHDNGDTLWVGVFWEKTAGEGEVTGLTVGGVSATLVQSAAGRTVNGAAQLYRVSASGLGSSALAQWTRTGSVNRSAVAVYRTRGFSTTPHDQVTFEFETNTSTSGSANIDHTAGGVILGFAGKSFNSATSWTGISSDFVGDINANENSGRASGSGEFGSAGTLSLGFSYAEASQNVFIAALSLELS
ncbi:MAG: hypothetical protein AAFR28_03650 [Pseudomonadota bacterium]